MPLTYAEAHLFVRAGDDMRRKEWPSDWFIREVPSAEYEIAGLSSEVYVPTQADINTTDWGRA